MSWSLVNALRGRFFMTPKKILFSTLFFSSILLFVHLFAIKENWYYTTFIDVLTHSMGGGVICIIVSCFYAYLGKKNKLFLTLLSVFVVGVLWEIFELVFYIVDYKEDLYFFDTFKDLIFDLLGAFITYEIINSLWKSKNLN